MRRRPFLAYLLASVAFPKARAAGSAIPVVAAENFYADVASQIGGPWVTVQAIMSNPEEDPHLFEASPSVARALAAARIVVLNGADYDPWMTKLLGVRHGPGPRVLVVAELLGRKAGENPHLWYDPACMPLFAKAFAAMLAEEDPARRDEYEKGKQRFLAALAPMQEKIATLRARFAGTPVTATEPVFNDMARALGLAMRNERFQLAVMNDTEPAASDVAAFEEDLKNRRVRLLIYNSQATNEISRRMLKLAKLSGIPVLGVTETEPAGKSYQEWMLSTLFALDQALAKTP